jgi:hypothetical protein
MAADELSGAEHAAAAPPSEPLQVHIQGPLPLIFEALPLVQSPDVGLLLTATLSAMPQTPVTGDAARGVEHRAIDKQIVIRIQRY